MNNLDTLDEWMDYLDDRGVDETLAKRYFNYGEKIILNNAPIILELEHLSKILGIKLSSLSSMIARPDKFYRQFTIKKRSGGTRTISAPYPSLLHCQRWIYENILCSRSVHNCAHGFVRGRSIITNASCHIGEGMLLKMDLENFFPSIPISWVINYFRNLGYAKNVSYFLASLCCLGGSLAQGAATSPALANLLVHRLDNRIHGLAKSADCVYSRYADDICLTGNKISFSLVRSITHIVEDCGLTVNSQKTTISGSTSRKIITGISVSASGLKLPRPATRELRKSYFFIRTFGLISHMNNQRIKNPFYLQSLIGKFSFWIQIEPENQFALEAFDFLRSLNT